LLVRATGHRTPFPYRTCRFTPRGLFSWENDLVAPDVAPMKKNASLSTA
jgi:hypothetical protein